MTVQIRVLSVGTMSWEESSDKKVDRRGTREKRSTQPSPSIPVPRRVRCAFWHHRAYRVPVCGLGAVSAQRPAREEEESGLPEGKQALPETARPESRCPRGAVVWSTGLKSRLDPSTGVVTLTRLQSSVDVQEAGWGKSKDTTWGGGGLSCHRAKPAEAGPPPGCGFGGEQM